MSVGNVIFGKLMLLTSFLNNNMRKKEKKNRRPPIGFFTLAYFSNFILNNFPDRQLFRITSYYF